MIPKLYSLVETTDPLDLFGQMLAQAPFAVWMADRDGNVIVFNEAMRNLARIDDPARVFKAYNLFEDPVAKTQGLVPYIKRVLTGQVIETVVAMDLNREDFAEKTGDGAEVRYVRCLYFPLKDDHGAFDYVVQTVEDVTQEYMEDLELSRAARQLETANAEIVRREKEIIDLKKRVRVLKLQASELRKKT